MSGPIESKPPLWLRALMHFVVGSWGGPVLFLVLSAVLVGIAAAFDALTAGFVVTLVVAFVVGVGTLALIRWKQREAFADLRAKLESGELYEQLRRSRR